MSYSDILSCGPVARFGGVVDPSMVEAGRRMEARYIARRNEITRRWRLRGLRNENRAHKVATTQRRGEMVAAHRAAIEGGAPHLFGCEDVYVVDNLDNIVEFAAMVFNVERVEMSDTDEEGVVVKTVVDYPPREKKALIRWLYEG